MAAPTRENMDQVTRVKGPGSRNRGPKKKGQSEEMVLLNPKSEQVSEKSENGAEEISGESKI